MFSPLVVKSTQMGAGPAPIRRKCGCSGPADKCSAGKAAGSLQTVKAPPSVHGVLSGGGEPLDAAARAYMEPRFGFDFSRVRIHSDAAAARSANDIQALAYTINHSIAFSSGSYAPGTFSGRRLLAHELAHVIQQQAAPAFARGELAVGSANDAAEADAERGADAALSGKGAGASQPKLSSAAVIRRTPAPVATETWTTQQDIGEERDAKPPLQFSAGNHSVTMNVTRRFKRCNFVKIDDKRSATFYNPSASDLAIDRRICKGSVVMDAFLKEFSDGNAKGVEAGVAANIAGDKTQGRVEVGAIGQERNNTGGVGAKVEGSLKTRGVDLSVRGEYIRNILNKTAGTNPNEVDVTAGAEIDGKSVTVTGSDLAGKRQVTVNAGGTWDKPEATQCSICYSPAPSREFECSEVLHTVPDAPKTELQQERQPSTLRPEYRMYFAWDSVDPSEEDSLRSLTAANMAKMKQDLATPAYPGYRVTSINGYASPEGSERRINRPLSRKRAAALATVVRQTIRELAGHGIWHGPETVPEAIGRSELLGSNPAPPSAHLRDVIAASGKHSAEEVTALLTGKEILSAQLTSEFLDLFKNTTPDDWMKLFGLGADSALRPELEHAVNDFIDSKGKGRRPWERVFRPLRFAAVTLEGTEMTAAPQTKQPAADKPDNPATSDGKPIRVSEKERCGMYGEKAERELRFGPEMDPSVLQPQTYVNHGKDDCLTVPGGGKGRTAGCDYSMHEKSDRAPPAPGFAPKRL
jgi:hypothetical protein